MFFFGSHGVTTTKEKGAFFCPGCGTEQDYRRKTVRRFFTLYFIPTIPLDKLGEYVECQSCQGTYKVEVLSHGPAAAKAKLQAEFEKAVRRIMVLMMMADETIEEAEVAAILANYSRVTRREITEDDVWAEVRRARQEGEEVVSYAQQIAPHLNESGKELVMKAAMMVMAADGAFHQQELELLRTLGAALDMTRAHVTGLMSELTRPSKEHPPPDPAGR